MSNPFEKLAAFYDDQVKEQDEHGTAEKFKRAAEILLQYIETGGKYDLPKLTVENVSYGDGYFIFGRGTNSVAHFYVKETPHWKYGIWLSEIDTADDVIRAQIFCQFEAEIDKFKPSASMISHTINVHLKDCSVSCTMFRHEIIYIMEHPALAWYRDVHFVDYNTTYVPESVAKRRYELYLKAYTDGYTTEWLDKEVRGTMTNVCSKCGVDSVYPDKYCGNCGREMTNGY